MTGRRIRETRTIDHLPQIAVPHGQSVPLSPGPPLPAAAGPNASSFSFSHRVGEAEHEVRVHGVVVLIDHRLIGHKEDFAAGFMMLRIVHFNLDPAATAAATESLLKTLRYGAIPSAP